MFLAFCIPFFKKCILLLSIFVMSILKCVFLYRESGKICRSGLAIPSLSPFLDGQMQAIEVGLAKAPLGHFEEAGILQFFEVGSHASLPRPDIVGELLLAGKAGVIRPGVFQKHGICEPAPARRG